MGFPSISKTSMKAMWRKMKKWRQKHVPYGSIYLNDLMRKTYEKVEFNYRN